MVPRATCTDIYLIYKYMHMTLSTLLRSLEFFNDLYHRFLLSPKPSMKSMCLQAMAIVYGQCYEEIGAFNDTRYMVYRLMEVNTLSVYWCTHVLTLPLIVYTCIYIYSIFTLNIM